MINGLDLFSGIGGLSLALAPWVRPVAYCEIDKYDQSVLLHQMFRGSIALAPIWDDVCKLHDFNLPPIEIIYGGFPCQDISVAGSGAGLEGERSGLVFEALRLVREIKPRIVFFENVPAIRTRGAEAICKVLAREGYDCRWTTISAAEVGAPHTRKRWFLLAYANGELHRHRDSESSAVFQEAMERKENGLHGRAWRTEPGVGRVAHGIPFRVDRVKGLGGAVVPEQAREAFKRLAGI